ncbi:heme exporter protein CcmD [Octadecabacter ascidiaceicola]|uniref:Heme exporter protein D n=1 Tax=Octadecabacter ascidiaceicola TaxID=1655543 RepID=A0A238JNN6_9RHOB|nr:heme exporter protein CcmD [Octadecabacter ascidiaceicola]SMX32298.1 Heme exporter protein D (CcmD) [Octadecabacter ascidiaceicola]
MMPDLGNYAAEVLTAYALSVGLLVGLLVLSLRRSRKVSAQLAEVEARKDRADV